MKGLVSLFIPMFSQNMGGSSMFCGFSMPYSGDRLGWFSILDHRMLWKYYKGDSGHTSIYSRTLRFTENVYYVYNENFIYINKNI